MSFVSVFNSLRELFPQVDLRLLRAITIEHEDNINEAIEFILTEVLLPSSTTPEVSHIVHDNSDQEQVSIEETKCTEHIAVPDDKGSSLVLLNYVGEDENRHLHSIISDSTEDPVLFPCQLMSVDANTESAQRLEAFDNNNSSGLNICLLSDKMDGVLFNNAENHHYNFELLSNEGCDLTEHRTKLSDNVAMHANGEEKFQVSDEDNVSVHFAEKTISSSFYDKSGSPVSYGSEKDDDINTRDGLSGWSAYTFSPINASDLETVVDAPLNLTSMLRIAAVSESDQTYQNLIAEKHVEIIDHEKQNIVCLDENSLELSLNKNDDYSILKNLTTRSGHTVCTDLLEDSISDVKNNKKALVSALDSMVNMMQETELLEEKAILTKEDISVANKLILSKVDELQKIVKQSKDEKDVHAGEVYGERSILAAEARELQSRLLKMSAERREYLSVTDEIFRALEARKIAAEAEVNAANIEKSEKEEFLQKYLKDHDVMMNSLLAESQKLQQEAEENNKLREFLMDRGRVVDSLQGEIAIVFEDIVSLKKKVEGHAPVSKFLPSSSWAYGGTSGKASDSKPLDSPEHRQSSSPANRRPTSKESPEEHQQVESAAGSRNALDEWELCDN